MASSALAATCFAVDDDTARIVVFDRDTGTIRFNAVITDGIGGPALTAELIESAYFDSVQNRYYVVVQNSPNRFGYIDPFTGAFIQVAASMGTTAVPAARIVGNGNGATGIRGLTRNPATGRWYVIDQNGFLYEINPTTGQFVPGAFGGNDYIQVTTPTGATVADVEDLAFDATGRLFVIQNDPGPLQLLRDVSLITGRAASGVNTGRDEAEGLALTDGQLRLIIGGFGSPRSNFYRLDTNTGATTLVFNLPDAQVGVNADYEAQGCNDSSPRADLALTKTVTPSAIAPGGTLTYVLTLVNQGIDPAYRVQVEDVLDPGMFFQSVTFGAGCSVCSFNTVTSQVGSWTVDAIDIGQRRTLTLVVSTAGVPGNTFVTNRAQVSQSCTAPVGACVPLADFDSTPANKSGAWQPTEDDEAVAGAIVTTQPSVGKAFRPVLGLPGETTTLVITLTNANTSTVAVITRTFTDFYPAGVVNAATPAPATSCAGGVAAATAGLGTVTLAPGATIPAGGSCTLTAVVTAAVVGTYLNTVSPGQLTVTVAGVPLTNPVGASAQYQVTPANINVIKDFTPDAAGVGGSATLRITFSNPTSVTASFTTGFLDTYPAGLVNYSTPNPQTSCPGTGVAGATAGLGTVTLPNTRAIGPSGSCTLTVVVTSAVRGTYTNAIPAGSVVTSAGSNLGTASAPIIFDAPSVSKFFSPTSSIVTGATVTLFVVLTNPLNTLASLTQLFTDNYPAGIVNHAVPAPFTTCVGGAFTATAGASTLTFGIGTQIPPLSSCFGRAVVRANPVGLTGTFVNTIPAGSLTTNLGSNSSAATATLTISTLTDLTVAKTASVATGTPGQTFSYTVTVVNLGPSPATSLTLTDLMAGVQLTSSVTIGTAGVGASVGAIATTSTSINATLTLPVNGTATFRFVVQPTQFNGRVTNTAFVSPQAGAADSNPNNNTASVAVNISATALLTVAKTNGTNTVAVGGTTSYTLTFVNSGPSDASGAIIKDTPSAGLSCTSLTCAGAGGAACTGLTPGALIGGHPIATFPSASTLTVVLTCAVTASGT